MSLQRERPPLVLASASAARQALLRRAGLVFDVQASRIDEAEVKAAARAERASAGETAVLLAHLKGERIARRFPEALVIGADQLLQCEDRWLDKPRDLDEAREHLRFLRGRTHELVTAVVCWRNGSRVWHHVCTPRLTMRRFSDEFLEAYLAAEADFVTTSVGGYRVEGPGILLFETTDGDEPSILGLPLLPLLGFLRQHGVLTQ
jgi:septum formation protein